MIVFTAATVFVTIIILGEQWPLEGALSFKTDFDFV